MGRLVPWNRTHTERCCCCIERTHRAKRHPSTRLSFAAIQTELNGFPPLSHRYCAPLVLCVGKIDELDRWSRNARRCRLTMISTHSRSGPSAWAFHPMPFHRTMCCTGKLAHARRQIFSICCCCWRIFAQITRCRLLHRLFSSGQSLAFNKLMQRVRPMQEVKKVRDVVVVRKIESNSNIPIMVKSN